MTTYTSRDVVFKLLRAPESGSWGDGEWNDIVDQCISTAGELIDQMCGGPFERAPAEAVTRRYRATGTSLLLTDKYVGTPTRVSRIDDADDTVVVLDSRVWRVGIVGDGEWPNRHIEHSHAGMTWLRYEYDVQARWGWEHLPASVAQAAAMLAARLFKRIDSPLGIVDTSTGPAYVSRYDSDIGALLDQYRGANGIGTAGGRGVIA